MRTINLESNIYDTLGFILPGLTVLVTLYWLYTGNLSIDLTLYNSGRILIIGYLLGHLLQSLANIIEGQILQKHEKIRWLSGFPKYNPLSTESKFYTDSTKRIIKTAAIRYFKLGRNASVLEIQKLCQSLLIQKGLNSNIEKFVAMFGFYRGLTLSMFLSTLVFLVRWKVLVDNQSFLIGVATLTATVLFWQRYKRFGKIFADYVYRDFYVFYQGLKER